jgi:hypothetical protein
VFVSGDATFGFPVEEYEKGADESASCILSGASKQARKADFHCDTVHAQFPAEGILETANKNHCNLIVMASHGRRCSTWSNHRRNAKISGNMKTKNALAIWLFWAISATTSASAQVGLADATRGQELAARLCSGCHIVSPSSASTANVGIEVRRAQP